jgi:hypothetical protein
MTRYPFSQHALFTRFSALTDVISAPDYAYSSLEAIDYPLDQGPPVNEDQLVIDISLRPKGPYRRCMRPDVSLNHTNFILLSKYYVSHRFRASAVRFTSSAHMYLSSRLTCQPRLVARSGSGDALERIRPYEDAPWIEYQCVRNCTSIISS